MDTTDIGYLLDKAGLNYSKSYAQSREVVEAALQENKDLLFMFDLHRDSSGREHTTFEMDGKQYARPFFVIGKNNPNYQSNVRFAEALNNILEERYPGLSRGILARQTGHGEYNQSLSEYNLLNRDRRSRKHIGRVVPNSGVVGRSHCRFILGSGKSGCSSTSGGAERKVAG